MRRAANTASATGIPEDLSRKQSALDMKGRFSVPSAPLRASADDTADHRCFFFGGQHEEELGGMP